MGNCKECVNEDLNYINELVIKKNNILGETRDERIETYRNEQTRNFESIEKISSIDIRKSNTSKKKINKHEISPIKNNNAPENRKIYNIKLNNKEKENEKKDYLLNQQNLIDIQNEKILELQAIIDQYKNQNELYQQQFQLIQNQMDQEQKKLELELANNTEQAKIEEQNYEVESDLVNIDNRQELLINYEKVEDEEEEEDEEGKYIDKAKKKFEIETYEPIEQENNDNVIDNVYSVNKLKNIKYIEPNDNNRRKGKNEQIYKEEKKEPQDSEIKIRNKLSDGRLLDKLEIKDLGPRDSQRRRNNIRSTNDLKEQNSNDINVGKIIKFEINPDKKIINNNQIKIFYSPDDNLQNESNKMSYSQKRTNKFIKSEASPENELIKSEEYGNINYLEKEYQIYLNKKYPNDCSSRD